jgi:hypothetical protein
MTPFDKSLRLLLNPKVVVIFLWASLILLIGVAVYKVWNNGFFPLWW